MLAQHNITITKSQDFRVTTMTKLQVWHTNLYKLYKQIFIVVVYQHIHPRDQTVPLEAAHIKHTYTQAVSITVMTIPAPQSKICSRP
jgi:hypothetical protein